MFNRSLEPFIDNLYGKKCVMLFDLNWCTSEHIRKHIFLFSNMQVRENKIIRYLVKNAIHYAGLSKGLVPVVKDRNTVF